MPKYDYYCDANDETIELTHSVETEITLWGQVCYAAQIPLGDTDPLAPVRRILTSAPALNVVKGPAELKNTGFTQLVKRDKGVYENVTATGDEKRYMVAGDPESIPHIHKKVGD